MILTVRFDDPMACEDVLDWEVPMAPVLEDGEAIDPGDCDIVIGAEAAALGFEVIHGDAQFPDPELLDDGEGVANRIGYWARIVPAYRDHPAFKDVDGVDLPVECIAWTTNAPRRRRGRTVLTKVCG